MYLAGLAVAAGLFVVVVFAAILAIVLLRHRRQPVSPPPPPEAQAVTPGVPGAPLGEGIELVAISGPLATRHFTIPDTGLTIGRQADNDIVLADEPMVSRHHAALAVENGQCVLYDRDSVNGTWVNERRVFRHVLAPGDRLQIWQSEFVFAGPAAPPPPAPAPEPVAAEMGTPAAGERLDEYVIQALVGRGGMSEVYRAVDPQGQTVAIKVLCEQDPYVVAKFVQEGNQIGPLLRQHPGIVYVWKFGRSRDGRLYIVMEYVQAPSLRKLMKEPLLEQQAVRIAGQLCAALAFAHQHHIVHRDVKPENVLVLPDGVKVLDFGVAKLTSASTVTRNKIVGTPEYLSPEQARGDPVQPASDVYAVGVVLYEMLTGSVPFPRAANDDPYRAALEVVRRHLQETPLPLRKQNPAAVVSDEVERVVMQALDKDPAKRYPTAREMAGALGYSDPGLAPPAQEERPAARLLVVQGPCQGQRIALDADSVSLGRLELGSTNQTISRRHVTIYYQGGSYWLQDTSRNGTWVNNERVYGQVMLQPGANIVIGDVVLSAEIGS